MSGPEPTELLVRATATYLPIVALIALVLHHRPDRRRVGGAVIATAWNVVGLLAVNLTAQRFGWWTFQTDTATVGGVPVDLWLGWALLWGAVPILATVDRLHLAAVALFVFDVALMPFARPVVALNNIWLVGEAFAPATCLIPGLLLGRWTARAERLKERVVLQVIAFAGLSYFVIPSLILTTTGEDWTPLLERPRWQFLLALVLIAPPGAMAIQAVREFVVRGNGTPVPLDPPTALVTTGPYAFVANPMQLGGTVILAAWGVLLSSPAVVAAAVMGAAFCAGIAAWNEESDLLSRFGDTWHNYRRHARLWLPRWKPHTEVPAVVYVAATCTPCSEVAKFLAMRPSIGLDIEPAELADKALTRITYVSDNDRVTGVAAIARSLEHVNLAWAAASWIARLPMVDQLLQLIADTVGGGPRSLTARQNGS